MARARTFSSLSPDFEAFLYAPMEEGQGRMPVSVLSALARLDVDPWEEAARLAALPKCNAARRLAHLMARLPDASLAHRDVEALARRLVTLLPDRGGMRHYELPSGFLAAKTTRRWISFLVSVLIGMQWFVTSCHPWSQREASSPPPTNSAPGPVDGAGR